MGVPGWVLILGFGRSFPAAIPFKSKIKLAEREFERLFLGGFLLGQFVVDILLNGVGVGTDDAAAIDEDRGGAVDFQEIAVGETGIDGLGGFRAAQARLESVLVQALPARQSP